MEFKSFAVELKLRSDLTHPLSKERVRSDQRLKRRPKPEVGS